MNEILYTLSIKGRLLLLLFFYKDFVFILFMFKLRGTSFFSSDSTKIKFGANYNESICVSVFGSE